MLTASNGRTMSRRWRAASAGDTSEGYGFGRGAAYPSKDLLIRRQASIRDQVQRTSRYLEHQRVRLQRIKSDIEKRVNLQLGRSTGLLHVLQYDGESQLGKTSNFESMNELIQERRYPYRSISTTARQRSLYNNVDDFLQQVSKSQPSIYNQPQKDPNSNGRHTAIRSVVHESYYAPTAATPPSKPDRGRHPILSKSVIAMSSPSSSSSSSPSIRQPISLDLNGGSYHHSTNGVKNHHQNNDGRESQVSLSPSGLSSRLAKEHQAPIYSKIRHRYRSPMNGSGLSGRSSGESSTSSTLTETTNGHQSTNEEQTKDIVFDSNGDIVSGTLSALLKKLMPSKDYFPEKSYIFSFLLNARLFISPLDILHEIVQHCIFEQNAKGDNFRKELRSKFFHNVLKLMSEWTETFPYDFRNDKMKERLKLLLELCCSATDPSLRGYKSVLLQNVANKVSKLERYEKALNELQRDVTRCVHPSEIFTGIAEKCSSPTVVAQQLTHIELERLSMIGPEEFINAFARECSSKDTTLFLLNHSNKGAKNARNIEHYVDWCNRLSRLIATEVCRHLKKKHRVRVIEFFIDVAKECFNMGNFNSLMAVVGGMDMIAVSRLKKTWAKVDVSKLAILEHQLDPSGNFLSYRSTLKAAVWRSAGATKDSERIVVPFFSLLWKDLLVSYEGCAKHLPNGHLNFAMFQQFASQMTQFLQWKQVECPFERNDTLLRYILTSPTFTDKALQLVSFEYEPPEQQAEKDLQKTLKMSPSSSP